MKTQSSWKTTLLGFATMALSIASIFVNPDLAKKLNTVAAVTISSGLVAAKDSSAE